MREKDRELLTEFHLLFHSSYIKHAQNNAHHNNERNEYLDAHARRDPLTARDKKDAENCGSHEGAKYQQRTCKEASHATITLITRKLTEKSYQGFYKTAIAPGVHVSANNNGTSQYELK